MKKSDEVFEIKVNEGSSVEQLVIRPEQTTDGVPIYYCYSASGTSLSEVRQEASGEWVQLWGSLPDESVERIGAAIARRRG